MTFQFVAVEPSPDPAQPHESASAAASAPHPGSTTALLRERMRSGQARRRASGSAAVGSDDGKAQIPAPPPRSVVAALAPPPSRPQPEPSPSLLVLPEPPAPSEPDSLDQHLQGRGRPLQRANNSKPVRHRSSVPKPTPDTTGADGAESHGPRGEAPVAVGRRHRQLANAIADANAIETRGAPPQPNRREPSVKPPAKRTKSSDPANEQGRRTKGPVDENTAVANEVEARKREKSAAKEARRVDLEQKRRELYLWNEQLKQQFLASRRDHTGATLDGV